MKSEEQQRAETMAWEIMGKPGEPRENTARRSRNRIRICPQIHLWIGQPSEALPLAQKAWDLAQVERYERNIIRAILLNGEAALGLGALVTAEERLHHALNRARAVNFVDGELPELTALADLQRQHQQCPSARELLEQVWAPATRGPYHLLHADALNVTHANRARPRQSRCRHSRRHEGLQAGLV